MTTVPAAGQAFGAWLRRPVVRIILAALAGAGVLFALYELSRSNYLFFHWLAEGFSIVIAFAIFAIAWNSRRFLDNRYFLLVGIAYVFIGGLDFLHTLTYKGMGVFPQFGSNPATQLWIAARYLEALTFLAAPLFIRRRLNVYGTVFVYIAVTGLLLATMFTWHIFPTAYVDGSGLTHFKIVSEYIISVMLAAAAWQLYRQRRNFNPGVVRLLVAALIVTIASELAFTLYTDVYGIANMIGHLLKVVSYYLVYKAIIETGLQNPYDFLFRNLKQSEERLRESDQRLRWALGASGSGAWDWDLETGVAWWSPEMFRLWGLPPDTVMTLDNSLDAVVAEDREMVNNVVNDAIVRRTDYSCEFRIRHPERGERWINSLGRGVYDAAGRAVRMLGISLDITEHKKVDTIKDEFIGLVSHELRTPMTILTGTLHVASLPNIKPEERDQMIRDARHSSDELGQILDNLVELSRHQAGRLRLLMEETDIGQLVRDIVAGEQARLEGFDLVLDVPDTLPPFELDRVRVRQVLRNLLSNAVKYSPAGTELRVTARERNGEVLVSVADQGKGLTPEEQSRLFQPFERLGETAGSTRGLGLGLLVCKRLVEAHGGRIWVASTPGQGATFSFTLPVRS
jgi:PAS domain S-box-containing protein